MRFLPDFSNAIFAPDACGRIPSWRDTHFTLNFGVARYLDVRVGWWGWTILTEERALGDAASCYWRNPIGSVVMVVDEFNWWLVHKLFRDFGCRRCELAINSYVWCRNIPAAFSVIIAWIIVVKLFTICILRGVLSIAGLSIGWAWTDSIDVATSFICVAAAVSQ